MKPPAPLPRPPSPTAFRYRSWRLCGPPFEVDAELLAALGEGHLGERVVERLGEGGLRAHAVGDEDVVVVVDLRVWPMLCE